MERSDITNAVALAAVLLALGYLTLYAVGRLTETVDEGLWSAEGGEIEESVDIAGSPLLRPSNEISVLVGNGSDGRQGLAGRASRRLESAGYGTLTPENRDGEPIEESFVYYIDGFKVDAIQIASVLNIAEGQVRPLLDNPGVPTEGADVIVILGQNVDF
ncbi:MAG: LytR C-terminal domain-containing protein [Actinomycetota bacterium]